MPLWACSLTLYLSMQFVSEFDCPVASANATENSLEYLTRNALTTAGAAVAAGTVVAGGALLTVALPAQMTVATGLAAGLYYAGDRQAKGLPINPFSKKEDEAVTEPAPEAA
jgi:hypothetical protein